MIGAVLDTSALIRAWRGGPALAERTAVALTEGQLALCEPVRLELLRGARNASDAAALDVELGTMAILPADDDAWTLARRTLAQIAGLPGGRHRGPSVTALLVAAIAQRHDVAVIHDDSDFELIARVTGQPVARIAG